MSIAKCPAPAILPIIFVPGIMGSRLSSNSRVDAWDPPSPFGVPDDAIGVARPVIEIPDGVAYAPSQSELDNIANISRKMRANDEVPRWGTVAEWAVSDAVERRTRLVGNSGQPFSENFLFVNMGNAGQFSGRLPAEEADDFIARGWGGLVWEFYGGFMLWLQRSASMEMCGGAAIKIEA